MDHSPNVRLADFRPVNAAVDGQEMRIEDPQAFFDDQARITLIPVLDGQISIQVKRQQLRERWPSRIAKEHFEPLLLKDWNPIEIIPECKGDKDVTAIVCSIDNLEMLKRQIDVLKQEVGTIIVVNNGSKDDTAKWLSENPLKGMQVIHRDNNGAGPGRNAGLALWDKHPTPYTLMVDGGILPPLGGVRAMKAYLKRHPEVTSISPEIPPVIQLRNQRQPMSFLSKTSRIFMPFNRWT